MTIKRGSEPTPNHKSRHIFQSFKETGNRIGQKGMPHSQQGVRKVKTHKMDDFKC